MASPLLKVCGLTRPEDVALCHDLGVAFTGFVMAGESPRYVAPSRVAAMPGGAARRVGVFTGAPVEAVREAVREAALDYVQLHGGQDEAFCEAVGPTRVIKVLWPERIGTLELAEQLIRFAPYCAYFLFDAGKSGGGGGRPFAWEILRDLRIPKPWLLAGGLSPENIGEAAGFLSPHALDVNSGAEVSPGVKDAAKIRAIADSIAKVQS